jgi:hypothetical protein
MPRKNKKTNKNKSLFLGLRAYSRRSVKGRRIYGGRIYGGGSCGPCMMRGGKTFKQREKGKGSLPHFYRLVTLQFLEMLNTVKLYHWKTYSYATHKATDELYGKLNENIDHFIEVLLGKTGQRIDLSNVRSIPLKDYTSVEVFKREVESYKAFLVGLDNNPALQSMSNTDLYNIRDELLGNLNQFLYLLTFTK